jgi:aldose 1-epimerase
VCISTYGATLVSIRTADRNGHLDDVLLGYDSLQQYVSDRQTYLGATIGRYAGRIADGSFAIDGTKYRLPLNDNGNTLHGGPLGFDKRLWTAREVQGGIEFTLLSADGDMGFPGALTAAIAYTLIDKNLRLEYSATTDQATIVNLTNHAYFNLSGNHETNILDHEIVINADYYTPISADLLSNGELAEVAGTPLDIRNATQVGSRIYNEHLQLKYAGGFDHYFVLNGTDGEPKLAATLYHAASGRSLSVTTTEPGIQFYSGNSLDGTFIGRHGVAYSKHAGLCLETQHFSDIPNHSNFPKTLLRPGEKMRSSTIFTFGLNS